MEKIAVVTGSNKGIGFEIARQLTGAGVKVVVAARNEARGKEAAEKLGADFMLLDVSDRESISKFAGDFTKKYGRLDVLINNAGILEKSDNNLLEADAGLVGKTFATNAFGPFFLSRALVPLMQAGGRIINVSSGGGSMSEPVAGWGPVYCASKSLLNAFTRQLAHALESKKISVNAICPGWVRTDMGGRGAPRDVKQGADTAVWLATEKKIPTGKIFRDRKEIEF